MRIISQDNSVIAVPGNLAETTGLLLKTWGLTSWALGNSEVSLALGGSNIVFNGQVLANTWVLNPEISSAFLVRNNDLIEARNQSPGTEPSPVVPAFPIGACPRGGTWRYHPGH